MVKTRKEIAAIGGAAVPAEKRSFSKDKELAARAGRKGGKSLIAAKRSFSLDRELAIRAGSKGGKAPRKNRIYAYQSR